MRETHSLLFAPFRLDLGTERLWCGKEARQSTRKAFAALYYLVAHAGQLVTKEELIEAVWAVPYVSDTALAACIRAIRRALDEQAHVPQFVETVRGRGYRFLAAVTVETLPVASVGADGGGAGRRRKQPPSAAWLWHTRPEMSCRPWMPSCSWPEPRPMKATMTWPSGSTNKPRRFVVS